MLISDSSGMLELNEISIFSPCEHYRYTLHRRWCYDNNPPIVWIGLNPSKADDKRNDNTISRCIKFSMYFGESALVMLNLFAFRSTNPAFMFCQKNPIGPDNDEHIEHWVDGAKVIVCWGADGAHMDRDKKVMSILKARAESIFCLGLTSGGSPRHPSRLGYDTPLIRYEGR